MNLDPDSTYVFVMSIYRLYTHKLASHFQSGSLIISVQLTEAIPCNATVAYIN